MVIPNIGFRCWNLTTGECTGNIDYDVPDPINYQTVFTNDENYVLVSTGKTNILIDMTKNKVLKEFNPWYTTYKTGRGLVSIAYDNDKNSYIFGTADGCLIEWPLSVLTGNSAVLDWCLQ